MTRAPVLTPGQPLSVAQAAAEVITEQARALRRHAKKAREGRDAEAVHQMRVATRKLRAALRVFAGHLEVPEKIARGLKELAGRLGRVRDRDVLIALVEDHHLAAIRGEERARLNRLLRRWRAERRDAQARLRRIIGGKKHARLLERLAAYAHAPRAAGDPATPAARVLQEAVDRQAAGLAAHEAMIEAGPAPEALHDLRIAFKRMRYTLDFHAAAVGLSYEAERRLARQLQDTLGEIHDRDILLDRLARGRGRYKGGWPQLHTRLAHERQSLVRRFLRRRRAWQRQTLEPAAVTTEPPRFTSLEPARVQLRLVTGRKVVASTRIR